MSRPAPTRGQKAALVRRRLRQRRLAVLAVFAVALLVAAGALFDWWLADTEAVPVEPAAPVEPAPTLAPPPPAPATTEPVEPPEPVLALAGDFPDAGSRTFTYAPDEGDVIGEGGGPVRRYRVGVEDGSGEDLTEFAAIVTETLRHPQGWTAGGYRFQQVPDGAGHDFTIFLATSQTTGAMCAAAGLYVIVPSFPDGGVSCSPGRRVILNLSRWRLSVPHYVDDEVPLETYRQMLLNHELGHELGYGHYGCPGGGQPAPVMMQQTLRLDGCEANPWPYLDGVHHTGPPAP